MECVTTIINLIVEPLMVPVKKHLGFFFSSTKHVTNMNERLQNLNETKLEVEENKNDALRNDRLIPYDRVRGWLERVESVIKEAGTIPNGGNGCLNLKTRYKAGKRSFSILEKINNLLEQQREIKWTDKQRPLGRVISTPGPSTSKTAYDHDIAQNIFPSRKLLFNDVLELLEADNETQMVGLWGMGGVGKTTMMEDIEKAVKKRRMFKWVVRKTIGTKYDPIDTQKDIAKHVGVALTEDKIEERAVRLGNSFEGMSKNGEKILIILDDVWEAIKLKDIGLTSHFPKGFKLLVTSRNERVLTKMNVEEVFKMVGIEEAEANSFFWKTVGLSDADGELRKIGENILKKCGGLPIAIKTIAEALKDEEKDAWEIARKNLQRHNLKDIDNLDGVAYTVFNISYDYLKKDDDKAIFVLCGLFQDDFDISLEELVRYGWGLQLFMRADSLDEARKRTNMSVRNLIRANLLTESSIIGCVKMHDLARAFVLGNISKFKQASIVNKSEWPTRDTCLSCERILLTCKGMSEFPADFYYPYASLLKIMNGDRLLELPDGFHERMEKLKVIAYDKMQNPLFLASLQCSISLRTLFLDSCLLVDNNISFLGELLNLEVLSIARCNIRKLTSAIGKLKRLKLLDLTGCVNLCIDDGVLENLKNLEELYMRASEEKPIRFTDPNCDELKVLSEKLIALEFEFFENILQPKNMSFEKLQRFRISIGCSLNVETKSNEDRYYFKNTLDLTTNRSDILDCKINVLFSKTEKLHLSVKDMIYVEDIMSASQNSTFSRLKVLHVSNCQELTHLFTIPVANGLKLLESLTVSSCPALKSLVSLSDSVKDMIYVEDIMPPPQNSAFSRLKVLHVSDCQELTHLFTIPVANGLKLLESLTVSSCPALKSLVSLSDSVKDMIYVEDIMPPPQNSTFSRLKVLHVSDCQELTHLFTIPVANGLKLLESLTVSSCPALKSLVSLSDSVKDMIYVEDIMSASQNSTFSRLKVLHVSNCQELTHLFTIPVANGLKLLESLTVSKCPALKSLVSLSDSHVKVMELPELVKLSLYELHDFTSIIHEYDISDTQPLFNKEVMFPKLSELTIYRLKELKKLWADDITSGEEDNVSMLRKIEVVGCDCLVNLFPRNPMRLLSHLEEIKVERCCSIEVLFNIDLGKTEQHRNTSSLRRIHCENLHKLTIRRCKKFRNVFAPTTVNFDAGSIMEIAIMFDNNDAKDTEITDMAKDEDNMSVVEYPSYHLTHAFHDLRKIRLDGLKGVEVMFEMECPSINREPVTTQQQQPLLPYLQELELNRMDTLSHVWKCNNWNELFILHKHQPQSSFQNLTTIKLYKCSNIKYLFSPLMAKLLSSLKRLYISNCQGMEEIVLSEVDDIEDAVLNASAYTLFPCLDDIYLFCLDNLKHLGGVLAKRTTDVIHDQFKSGVTPSYAATQMHNVQSLRIFYCGSLVGVFGSEAINNINDCTSSNFDQGNLPLPRPNNIAMRHDLTNLKILTISRCGQLEYVFTFSTLESLKNLKELSIDDCKTLKVIVREENGEKSLSSKVVLPRLKSITLSALPKLEGFFLGRNVDFEWPSLDYVYMENCTQMMVFTYGESTAPNLKCIHTRLGKHNPECGLNFHQTPASSSDGSSLAPAIAQGAPWSYHNLVSLKSVNFKKIVPSNELLHLQNLEEVIVGQCCWDVEEVFEVTSEVANNESQTVVIVPKLRDMELMDLPRLKYLWKSNRWTRLEFPHLTRLHITLCKSLEYVFTPSMVGGLTHLQELYISRCNHMEVIIEKEEECDGKVSDIALPYLQSLKLVDLPRLKGVCLGKDNFTLPSLNTLVIKDCPEIEVFTEGCVVAPELKLVETGIAFFHVGEDINSFIMTKKQEGCVFGDWVPSDEDE